MGKAEEDKAEIIVVRKDDALTITGIGALDFLNSGNMRGELEKAATELDSVVVDLRQSYFIDTAILEYLAYASKILRRRDKRLKVIVRKGSHPERVLLISCFDQLMQIESEPAASEE